MTTTLANRAPARSSGVGSRLSQSVFDALYRTSLLYNACWEDPACDRQALHLTANDRVLVITSGGCNALDYALCGPAHVHAVDANPRQNALLDLKIAGIRSLEHDDFFRIFGDGWHPDFRQLYRSRIRAELPDGARAFWDRHQHWFNGRGWRDSFYFHGLSGLVARLLRSYFQVRPRLRRAMDQLVDCTDLATQRALYDHEVAPRLWSKHVQWAISRQTTMSLLGVPPSQTREVAMQHHGGDLPMSAQATAQGVAGFIRGAIDYVFRELPIWTNYFWTLYIRGHYTRNCCPEYLTVAGFAALKSGLVDRVTSHTNTITGFLQESRGQAAISRFVLLDHMDWMASHRPDDLGEEWDEILARAAPETMILFRSARAQVDWLDGVPVKIPNDGTSTLGKVLTYDRPLADRLHKQDRVGTYGGFHIAHLAKGVR